MDLPVTLQPGEELLRLVRRHPIFIILQLVLVVALTLLAIILLWWLAARSPDLVALCGVLILGTGVVGLVVGFLAVYRYMNDLWLITNQRLIDSLRTSPFNHQVSSTSLRHVQNTSIVKRGILATLFDFGDIVCQTASADGSFELRDVPEPTEVLNEIDRARAGLRYDVIGV
jgi:membrane protein YdbS with pleckstrin-like domain